MANVSPHALQIEGDEWPEELQAIAMVAIPKSDSVDVVPALKLRLIGVTSQLHRIWSSLNML